jgi:acyl carrier protein
MTPAWSRRCLPFLNPEARLLNDTRRVEEFTMETSFIYQKLTGVFHEVFDDTIVIRPDLTAKEVDEWDSLTHIRLMLTVERTFGIRFSAAEIGHLNNVGDLVALINAKTAT